MIFPRFNCMTISTPNSAFFDFFLSLLDALRITNIKRFITIDMIKVKGSRMRFKSTINTSNIYFIFIQPSPNDIRSIIRLFVDALLRKIQSELELVRVHCIELEKVVMLQIVNDKKV